MNSMSDPATDVPGKPEVVLFRHNSANEEDRLRSLIGPDWRILAVAEDAPQHEIDAAMMDCRILVSRSFDSRHRKASGLRLLQSVGAGLDRVDTGLLPEGCVVCNVHGHEIGIAEFVLAAMLDRAIGLRDLDRSFRSSSWQGGAHGMDGFHGELFGKTVGLLGYGAIGQEIARRAAAFGMRTGAFSSWAKPGRLLDWCALPGRIDSRLGELDYLVVCCPLTPLTRGLIDRRRLKLMKPEAVLINVGRAEVVKEADLVSALDEGLIAGAVLDVWYWYPTPGESAANPSREGLRELSAVVATPHASGWTKPLMDRKWRRIAANIAAMRRGAALDSVVFPPAASGNTTD